MIRKTIILFLSLFCLTACFGWVEYLEPSVEEITPERSEDGLLPQMGTTLHLKLNYMPVTKFQPGREWKMYRYRIFIDDEPYSYGVLDDGYCEVLDIPLLANDSHEVRTITAEGSMSLDFSGEEKWDDWHKIYEATQACLPESESRQYAALEEARLVLKIDGKDLYFDLEKNGTAESLKRFLYGRELSAIVQVNGGGFFFDWDSQRDLLDLLRQSIPANHGTKKETRKEGCLYFHDYGFGVFTADSYEVGTFWSLTGTVCPESRDDLQALRRKAESIPAGLYYSEVILSIETLEPYVIVEWAYEGWDDVYNELDQPVTITPLYTREEGNWGVNPTPHIILPGEYARLNAGSYLPGESIREHPCVDIVLDDGRKLELNADGYEPWNKRFFTNYSEEKVTEPVNVGGVSVNHTYFTRIYHIDAELITLWETAD